MSSVHARILFKKVSLDAILPTQRDGDVGFDVYAVEDAVIAPGATGKLRSGLQLCSAVLGVDVPAFVKVEDRSSMASKGIFTHGGIIDPTYRGEFHVVLHNSTSMPYSIRRGDRIAQLVVYAAAFNFARVGWSVGVEETEDVEETVRGSGGFGSTGR